MTKQELLKHIVQVVKETSISISNLEQDHSFEKPIMNDLVKTQKAMAYENVLSEIRKFKRKKEGN